MFACVGWQVTLCDPIWQVKPRSSEFRLACITVAQNCDPHVECGCVDWNCVLRQEGWWEGQGRVDDRQETRAGEATGERQGSVRSSVKEIYQERL